MSYRVTVTPIGTARQGYRVKVGETPDRPSSSFDVRTMSSRRYLVVSLRGQYVVKRTSDRAVAERARKLDELDRLIVDRRIIDATHAGYLGGLS